MQGKTGFFSYSNRCALLVGKLDDELRAGLLLAVVQGSESTDDADVVLSGDLAALLPEAGLGWIAHLARRRLAVSLDPPLQRHAGRFFFKTKL